MSDNKSSLARFLTARNLNDVIAQMIILLGERDKEKHGMGNQRRHIYKKKYICYRFSATRNQARNAYLWRLRSSMTPTEQMLWARTCARWMTPFADDIDTINSNKNGYFLLLVITSMLPQVYSYY